MNLADLNQNAGAYRARKRVGRGRSSGSGKTSGRGQKGAHSRSGFRRLAGFEGGQMPLFRRLPKRGFNNIFRTEYDTVNVRDLNRVEGTEVNHEILVKQGIIKARHGKLKILGDGQLEKKLVVEAVKFSASAKRQIEEQGGEARVVA